MNARPRPAGVPAGIGHRVGDSRTRCPMRGSRGGFKPASGGAAAPSSASGFPPTGGLQACLCCGFLTVSRPWTFPHVRLELPQSRFLATRAIAPPGPGPFECRGLRGVWDGRIRSSGLLGGWGSVANPMVGRQCGTGWLPAESRCGSPAYRLAQRGGAAPATL